MARTRALRFNVKKGLDLAIGAPPRSDTADVRNAADVALLGRDFPGVKLEVLHEEGTRVRAGEPVLRHRHRPEIVFTAPASGVLAAANRGARRTLVSLRIHRDSDGDAIEHGIPAEPDRSSLRALMRASGSWTALRTRPFARIPDAKGEPQALLITAIDTEPLAPDPIAIIGRHAAQFSRGLAVLGKICVAPLYLCRAPGALIDIGDAARVGVAEFGGPHPAGLPGTHVHSLCPIGFDGAEAWYIGYQDVISLGYLVTTGSCWFEREVALAGPAVRNPRVLRVPLGAAIHELVAGELEAGPVRVLSGSALSGHVAFDAEAYLGQRHRQITVLPEAKPERGLRWRRTVFDTALGGRPGPLVPTADLNRVAPPGILPVPLLRALLVGDVDRARDLGALELVEEDLALLGYMCPSKTDYGPLLRGVLNKLQQEGA